MRARRWPGWVPHSGARRTPLWGPRGAASPQLKAMQRRRVTATDQRVNVDRSGSRPLLLAFRSPTLSDPQPIRSSAAPTGRAPSLCGAQGGGAPRPDRPSGVFLCLSGCANDMRRASPAHSLLQRTHLARCALPHFVPDRPRLRKTKPGGSELLCLTALQSSAHSNWTSERDSGAQLIYCEGWGFTFLERHWRMPLSKGRRRAASHPIPH